MALGRNDDETTRRWRVDIERIHGLKKGTLQAETVDVERIQTSKNETATTELLKTKNISSWWLKQPIWKRLYGCFRK